jgi:hypothetical protein
MDYHVINNAEFLGDFDKPMFFWTKQDMLNYLSYLDTYIDALKNDYQKIITWQKENEKQILTQPQKKIITDAVIEWAHDREMILQDSEDTAFPFVSHVQLAEQNDTRINRAISVATNKLKQAGLRSESGEKKEEEKKPPPKGPLGEVGDIAKWSAIGLGIWIAYNIFRNQ